MTFSSHSEILCSYKTHPVRQRRSRIFIQKRLDNIHVEYASRLPAPEHISVELGSTNNSSSLPEGDNDEGVTEMPVEEFDPEVEDAEECPCLGDDNPKKAPGKLRIVKTSKRSRPRKQFPE